MLQWVGEQACKTPMNIVASDLATRDHFVYTVVQLNISKCKTHKGTQSGVKASIDFNVALFKVKIMSFRICCNSAVNHLFVFLRPRVSINGTTINTLWEVQPLVANVSSLVNGLGCLDSPGVSPRLKAAPWNQHGCWRQRSWERSVPSRSPGVAVGDSDTLPRHRTPAPGCASVPSRPSGSGEAAHSAC